uniref:Uncharacterized protein n=1 Tax=Knipowitschia caucasica TaxID=637954 RepID=A0AAV2K564_KNICA
MEGRGLDLWRVVGGESVSITQAEGSEGRERPRALEEDSQPGLERSHMGTAVCGDGPPVLIQIQTDRTIKRYFHTG